MRTTSTYTPINVTLTEGEIGIILCSLEDYAKNLEEDAPELLDEFIRDTAKRYGVSRSYIEKEFIT